MLGPSGGEEQTDLILRCNRRGSFFEHSDPFLKLRDPVIDQAGDEDPWRINQLRWTLLLQRNSVGRSSRCSTSAGALGGIRTPDPQIRSLVLYGGAAICLIIPCSRAPTLGNNIIQKGLAFDRDWSASVVNSGR
jgi:hypothetical protein